MNNERRCYRCKVVKLLEEFYNNKNAKYEKGYTCKVCGLELGNEYNDLNK